jgi:hypothetical protein
VIIMLLGLLVVVVNAAAISAANGGIGIASVSVVKSAGPAAGEQNVQQNSLLKNKSLPLLAADYDNNNENTVPLSHNPSVSASTAAPALPLSSRLQHWLWTWKTAHSVSISKGRAAQLRPYAAIAVAQPRSQAFFFLILSDVIK